MFLSENPIKLLAEHGPLERLFVHENGKNLLIE